MAKLYFAGASKQRHFIASLATKAEHLGHTITCKWWIDFEKRHRAGARTAAEDLAGVQAADALVMIVDDVLVSPGAHLELGFALALRKPVLAICVDVDKLLDDSIWFHLDCIHLADMADLSPLIPGLSRLLMLAQRAADRAPTLEVLFERSFYPHGVPV